MLHTNPNTHRKNTIRHVSTKRAVYAFGIVRTAISLFFPVTFPAPAGSARAVKTHYPAEDLFDGLLNDVAVTVRHRDNCIRRFGDCFYPVFVYHDVLTVQFS